MNVILAAGLVVLAMQPPTDAGAASAAPQARAELRIAGRVLKDTPDAVLQQVLADPATSQDLRSGIRGEIALRIDWRRRSTLESGYLHDMDR